MHEFYDARSCRMVVHGNHYDSTYSMSLKMAQTHNYTSKYQSFVNMLQIGRNVFCNEREKNRPVYIYYIYIYVYVCICVCVCICICICITPVKYERDLRNLTWFWKCMNYQNGDINERSLSNPHHGASEISLIARFMGPTWGPSGADRTQVGPMLAPWTLLSGILRLVANALCIVCFRQRV